MQLRNYKLAEITANTSKAVSTDYLAEDFQLHDAGNFLRISIAATTAVVVQLVPSSGTAIALNGGAALAANAVHTEDVAVDATRTWNVQNATGTAVISHLVVLEVGA